MCGRRCSYQIPNILSCTEEIIGLLKGVLWQYEHNIFGLARVRRYITFYWVDKVNLLFTLQSNSCKLRIFRTQCASYIRRNSISLDQWKVCLCGAGNKTFMLDIKSRYHIQYIDHPVRNGEGNVVDRSLHLSFVLSKVRVYSRFYIHAVHIGSTNIDYHHASDYQWDFGLIHFKVLKISFFQAFFSFFINF